MAILRKLCDIFVLILLAFTTLVLSVMLYVLYIWPNIDFEKIFFTIGELTLKVITDNIFISDYFFASLFFIIVFPLCYLFLNNLQKLILSIVFAFTALYLSGFIHYIVYNHKTSTLYEDYYSFVDEDKVVFPNKKRNLLLIYLESFENSFSNSDVFGRNLIQNISKLQKEGQYSNFPNELPGTGFSVASIIASQCAIPLKYIQEKDIWSSRFFLPRAFCFPELLQKNGYQTMIIKAADISFTGVDVFSKTHGYTQALGVNEILQTIDKQKINEHLGTFGGVTDRTLFDFAKQKLDEFDKNKPFMLTLFTLDTHTPKPYIDKSCPIIFNDLRDAFICSDRAVGEFIEWFKNSPYWDNTTVVIIGDHTLSLRIDYKGKRQRGIFNAFLNTPKNLKIDSKRYFSTFDLAPSIIESLGIKLPNGAFALGRSLFSDKPTLLEQLGFNKFKRLLQQNSLFYNELNKPLVARKIFYSPYELDSTIKQNDIPNFSDAYEMVMGSYFTDRLNLSLPEISSENYSFEMSFSAINSNKNYILKVFANDTLVYKFTNDNKSLPFYLKFDLPKKLLTDGKVSIKFSSNNPSKTPVQMGISPISIEIKEKK